jgi:hypothetical protein
MHRFLRLVTALAARGCRHYAMNRQYALLALWLVCVIIFAHYILLYGQPYDGESDPPEGTSLSPASCGRFYFVRVTVMPGTASGNTSVFRIEICTSRMRTSERIRVHMSSASASSRK